MYDSETITRKELCRLFDHTNLKAYADETMLTNLCTEAKEGHFAMVAINSSPVAFCKNLLKDTDVHVGAAISFPLGQTTIAAKVYETINAIENGADEIDYVINIGELKNKNLAYIRDEMQQIVDACHAAGFRPKFALLSSQWDFMVELVSKNHAVSILPKPVLDKHPDPNVCCVPMSDSMKYWDIVLAWNKDKYMPKACALFLDYCKHHLPPDDL